MSEHTMVGYLIGVDGHHRVICMECAGKETDLETFEVPIFDVNLRPYRQRCIRCEKDLINPHFEIELFDGIR